MISPTPFLKNSPHNLKPDVKKVTFRTKKIQPVLYSLTFTNIWLDKEKNHSVFNFIMAERNIITNIISSTVEKHKSRVLDLKVS